VLGPQRGLHLKLGDYESLVIFSGASELKQAKDGMPRPCLLKLHRLSTFKDVTYLAWQAFEFSGHSWRMLSPEPFPITIRYSDLIAERLAGLDTVPGWDSEAVDQPLGHRSAARGDGSRLHFAAGLQEGRKSASIHASSGFIWGIPVNISPGVIWGISDN
jgi:hypothetical protein